jgi:hypothetical protein
MKISNFGKSLLLIVACTASLISIALATVDNSSSATTTSSASSLLEPIKMVWFIFREDCFDRYFNKHDFTNVECFKFTLSKFIGYGIVAGSAILKVPQIIKIMKS